MVMYKCPRCGRLVSKEELEEIRGGQIKCPDCNYRVLMKVRPPIVKRLKSEDTR